MKDLKFKLLSKVKFDTILFVMTPEDKTIEQGSGKPLFELLRNMNEPHRTGRRQYERRSKYVHSLITGEELEIPNGWSDVLYECLIDLEQKDPAEIEPTQCLNCEATMSFEKFTSTGQMTGDLQTTAHMVIRNIPLFRCEPCKEVLTPMASVMELQQRAFAAYKQLNIWPYSEMKDFEKYDLLLPIVGFF